MILYLLPPFSMRINSERKEFVIMEGQLLRILKEDLIMKGFPIQGSNEKVTNDVPVCKNGRKGRFFYATVISHGDVSIQVEISNKCLLQQSFRSGYPPPIFASVTSHLKLLGH